VKILADLTPLRESPPFRRLWAGGLASAVGSALTAFAVSLQVYRLTGSTAAVGLLGLAILLPTLAVGLPGGALADAMDRRVLVIAATICDALASALLAVQAYAGSRLLWPLYALVAVSAAAGALGTPARRALIPPLLPAALLPAALALNRITFQLMMTVGPALAGLLVATPHVGLAGCYLIDAISFAAALYGVIGLPDGRPAATSAPAASAAKGKGGRSWPERMRLTQVAGGIAFIARTPVVGGAFLADLCATFFALPLSLFQAINAERFGGDPRTLGLFTTAIGIGGMVTAVLSGPVRYIARQGVAMLVSISVWGAAFAVFAIAHSLWLTLLALGVAGAADTVTVVLRGVIVQTVTPDEFRGRVTAADYVVGAGGGYLGSVESGVIGSLATPTVSALSGGLLTVASAIILGLAIPAFTRYRPAAHGGAPELPSVGGTEPPPAAGTEPDASASGRVSLPAIP
jgi:MFS family permease